MSHPFSVTQKAVALAACWLALVLPALAVTVTKTADLSFGKLVPGLSGGTVTLSSSVDASRTASGVILFTQGAGAAGSRAVFSVTGGPANASCRIVLPANDFVVPGSDGSTLVISSFTSFTNAAPGTITLNGLGAGTIYVGGTLRVGGVQPAGAYSDSLTVSVTCP